MHDHVIRRRLLGACKDTLSRPVPVNPRSLPRPVRALATRRFLAQLVPAAVLIGVVDDPVRLTLLLTERSPDMRDHAGQISFPGGRCEESDRNSVRTALREAEEEIALTPNAVTPIGQLGEYPTVTGFRVTPIIGLVTPAASRRLAPNPGEVVQIIRLPLRHILHLQHFHSGWLQRRDLRLPYRSLQWRRHRIWGATAAMLYELALRIRAEA